MRVKMSVLSWTPFRRLSLAFSLVSLKFGTDVAHERTRPGKITCRRKWNHQRLCSQQDTFQEIYIRSDTV